MMTVLRIVLVLIVAGFAGGHVWAQDLEPRIADMVSEPAKEAMPDTQVPEDEFERGTPRTAMEAYLRAARRGEFERAAEYLDFRNVGEDVLAIGKPALAEDFFQILDRTLWVDLDNLSLRPEGKLQDGLPSYREALGKIETRHGQMTLLLQRVPRGDGVSIWKVSNATVARIPELSEEFAYGPLGQWMSDHVPRISLLNVPLWIWLLLLSLLGTTWLLIWLLINALLRVGGSHPSPVRQSFNDLLRGPLCLMAALVVSGQFVAVESLGVSVAAVLRAQTLWLVCWAWTLNGVISLLAEIYLQRHKDSPTGLVHALLRPGATVAKSIVVVIIALLWLENLGFSPTAALAGLGIGGLAFALAAQKSIENMIGALTLYVSSPVKVGQLCRFGTQVGVIEEIGLRATRVRTLDRSVVHIPNAVFADMQLENISQRERIAYRPAIHLDGRSLPQSLVLDELLTQMRQVLNEHERVADDVVRVRFKAFEHHALLIDVLAYVDTTDYNDYLEVAESLNLALLGCVQKAGVRLASPMGVGAE
ncbi:mechanosensitive ion channel family protein [Simiduia agarivorans]|uniref:Mechanosensitive ion channel family protein n=1 Tax=Simiduia agarivorans (strain DSM 21679 / JCM 13881 / BCRC 17597 / SA1) TaxID=1117647 RepID=K4KZF9_SIMAS|nr:mechanosensitive ion channel domain-containing protein [Simiduia agarivorans]AFU99307.1 mechanosensitive ion channel family protein [Simiduia agarivorans SA1 = DSM 21679]